MDSFLTDLGGQGEHDSQGIFTIDATKAKLKLSQYQLASFKDFPKFLISAAICSGAARLRTFVNISGVISRTTITAICFEGWAISRQDLHAIGFVSLGRSGNKSLRYLATVISVLVSAFPVRIHSISDSDRFSFQLSEEAIEELPPPKEPDQDLIHRTVLEVSADLGTLLKSAFVKLAKWSSVTLIHNSERIDIGYAAGSMMPSGLGFLLVDGNLQIPVSLTNLQKELTVEGRRPSSPPQFLTLTAGTHRDEAGGVILVVDGQPYPAPAEYQLPGVSGFMVVNHLITDLSYQNLVHNEDLESVGRELQLSTAELLVSVLQRKQPLRPEQELFFRRLLARLEDSADFQEAERLLLELSERISPCVDPTSLELLTLKLKHCSEDEVKQLFDQYREQMRMARLDGRLARVSKLLRGARACRKALNQPEHYEVQLSELLRFLSKGVACRGGVQGEWSYFLSSVHQWCRRGSLKASPPPELVHPSWYLPVQIDSLLSLAPRGNWDQVCGPGARPWLVLLRLFSQRQIEEALKLVKKTPEFRFEAHQKLWLELFWRFFRGDLVWKQSVELRVALSKTYLAEGGYQLADALEICFAMLGFDATTYDIQAYKRGLLELSRESVFKEDFWPKFFALVLLGYRSFPSEVRGIWLGLWVQRILGQQLENPDGPSVLARPFDVMSEA